MTATVEPAELTAARDQLASIRQALARASESAAREREALTRAEAEHVTAGETAALEGLAAPKTPGSLKALRETVESAEAVLARLRAREAEAAGEVQRVGLSFAERLVRDLTAADVAAGRAALQRAAAAIVEAIDALGDVGVHLVGEVVAAVPHAVRTARSVRLSSVNQRFAEFGRQSPATNGGGHGLLIEAECPTVEEVRQLAAQ